ncbi:hypothetical protein BV20DRAFT_210328 [Pilatotrama ljubarskyi]|nr:hypothetical protein BV20DRAFT_210328 [Pilatotrama ljubarskyi]
MPIGNWRTSRTSAAFSSSLRRSRYVSTCDVCYCNRATIFISDSPGALRQRQVFAVWLGRSPVMVLSLSIVPDFDPCDLDLARKSSHSRRPSLSGESCTVSRAASCSWAAACELCIPRTRQGHLCMVGHCERAVEHTSPSSSVRQLYIDNDQVARRTRRGLFFALAPLAASPTLPHVNFRPGVLIAKSREIYLRDAPRFRDAPAM